jgi:DNA-binding transcriptional MocR family regulator
VEATIGRGTFVSDTVRPREVMPATMAAADRQLTPDGVISDMLQIHQLESKQMPGVRSMAVASPDVTLFPVDEFWQSITNLRPDAKTLLGYGSPQGDPLLRMELASMLRKRNLVVGADDVIVTAGLTQGLSLVTQSLAQAGDKVLVEQPTYLGYLNILKAQNLQPVAVPLDEEGPILAEVERAILQHRPRFFYTIPSYQNPTGICMSERRRLDLVTLAEQHGLRILEDDAYGLLSYDTASPPPLKALDQQELVTYSSSLSKTLMPGLRVGMVLAPPQLHEDILARRRATDLCSPPLLHRALAGFLQEKGLQRYLRRVLPIYRRRRDALLAALDRYMPSEVEWIEPAGGLCLWLTMPGTPALRGIHRAALQHGLAICPGDVFMSHASAEQHVRLSFGNVTEEGIRSSVELLANLIRERLEADQRQPVFDWTPIV